MSDFGSWLRCIGCGHKTDLLKERLFRCPKCGDLYDVVHDFKFITDLGSQAVSDLKTLFDLRQRQSPEDVRTRSGVWRFHELIFPSVSASEIVSLGEGMIPILPVGNNLRKWIGGNLDLWILPEGLTTTGSFKDFGGTVAITIAKMMMIARAIYASTGDTSAMVAAYCAAAGMVSCGLLPKGEVTDVQLPQPLMHGSKVILVPGKFDECMSIVEKLIALGRAFPINSINPTRIEGHQASVFLACQFFGWEMPDAFVVPVGNGSNSSSIGKGIRLLQNLGFVNSGPRPKIIGVQSHAANPLAASWEAVQNNGIVVNSDLWLSCYRAVINEQEIGKTSATAQLIGHPVSHKKVMREILSSNGAILTSEEAVLNEAVMVAGSDGFSVCPQTGTALSGLRQAVERGFVKNGARVVVVSTATGLKFPEVPLKHGRNNLVESPSCDLDVVARLMGV